ncbi:MAG: acyl-CoA thioester hydrolase [Polyangiales bacterium]
MKRDSLARSSEIAPPARSGFLHAFRPRYHETDQSGIVHHSVYLKWFEDARVALFRARGMNFGELERVDRVGMAVHHADVRYKLPARFDDEIEAEVWLGEVKRATLRFDYRLWRGEELLSEAKISIACIHLDRMRAIRVPDAVRRCCI